MIRSKDLNKEIKELELKAEKGDDRAVMRAILKGIALVLKVMRDVKTNQVLGLKQSGVSLIKPRVPETETKKEKK